MGRTLLWIVAAAALGLTVFLVLGLLGGDDGGSGDLPADDAALRDGGVEDAELRGTGQAGDLLRPEAARLEIVGRVLDGDGKPVAGCRVGAQRPVEGARDPRDPSTWTKARHGWGRHYGVDLDGLDHPMKRAFRADRTTETDGEGRYRIAVTELGSHEVRALVEPPLVGPRETAWVWSNHPRVVVVLRVLEGARLDGRVIDARGAGVAAVVRGRVKAEGKGWWNVDPVETDPTDGTFAWPALPAGEATFGVVIPGRLALRGHEVTLPHEGVWTIRLGAFDGAVAGRITDGSGEVVADAEVLVGVGEGETLAVGRAASSSDGTYRVEGLPAGEVTSLVVEREGFGDHTETTPLAPWAGATVAKGKTTTIDVTLLAGATVEGVVRERGTGRPLPDVEVFLLPRADRTGEAAVPNTKTDAAGRYALSGVAPGAHVLVARSATHYLPQMAAPQPRAYTLDRYGQAITPPPPPELMLVIAKTDSSIRRDFELAPGLTLRGRVVGPDGEPVGGAEVTTPQFGLVQVAWRWGVSWPGWGVPLAVTGADGRFDVHGLPPVEALALRASKRPLTSVETVTVRLAPDTPPEEVVIHLAPGVVVEGRVVDPDGNGVQAWIGAWSTSGDAGSTYTNTEPDGSFRLENLSAGGVRLMVTSQGFASVNTTLEAIPPGETKSGVEIRMRSGVRVSGVLLDQHGRGVPGRSLSLGRPNTGPGLRITTDENGYFETERAPKGRIQATVSVMEGDTGTSKSVGKPFDSPKAGLRLTLYVPERTVVEGTVVGPDGAAVPLCRVIVSSVIDGRVVRRRNDIFGWSDPTEVVNGAFRREVRGEPPFEIRVATPRDTRGQPLNLAETSVRVTDPAAGPVEIRLEEGLEVHGRFVDAEGNGIADVGVQLGSAMSTSDSQGAFRIGGLEAGEVMLQVTPPPGWVKPATRHLEPGDEEAVIELAPASAVAGTILDADGKRPSGYARVVARWESTGDVTAGVLYGIAQNGTFRVDGIPFGVTVHLEVTIYGSGRSAPIAVDVEAGTLDVEIRVSGAPGLAGVVVDESGQPVAAAQLSFRRADGSQALWAQTTEEGTFEISGCEPGEWIAALMRPGDRVVTDVVRIVAPTEEARLVLGKDRSITGRLVGKAEYTKFRVIAWADGFPGTQVGTRANVKEDGSFEVGGLGRGSVVLVSARGRLDQYVLSSPVEAGARGVELEIREGERIAGRVLQADGTSKAYAWVDARGDRYRTTIRTDENGAFEMRALPPGTYHLRVRGQGGQGSGPEVEVATGATDVQLRAP